MIINNPIILHISSEHSSFDDRIFYKELISLSKFYNCYLISGGNNNGMLNTMGNELLPKGVYNNITVLPYPIKPVKNIIIRVIRKFIPMLFYYFYNKYSCYKLIQLCNEYNLKPSILHYHDLNFSICAKILQKVFNCKLIFDCHEFYFSYFFYELTYNNLKKASKSILSLKNAVRSSDATISVTKNLDNIISLMNNNKNHIILYNCSNLPIFNNYHFNENDKIVLIHEGSLKFDRGLKLMLELFTDTYFYDKIKLKIVGRILGKELDYFNKKKIEYNIDDSMIEITGWIDYENLYNYLSGTIGIILFEKTFNAYYSMPNKLFNYINANLPILCTSCSELSDFINNNKIGYIVDRNITSIKEGIFELISNYDYYLSNIKNIQQLFSWENERKKLLLLYKDLLYKKI